MLPQLLSHRFQSSVSSQELKNFFKGIPNRRNGDKITLFMKITPIFEVASSYMFSKVLMSSVLMLTPVLANALTEIRPDALITDDSGVLTKSSLSFLEKNNQKAFEVSGVKIYIVSLRTLPFGEDVSEFTKNLFSKWQLKENEVLVVLVNKIARGSVCTGSDVKGLTESIKKSIGEETFAFKAKDEQYSSAAIDVSNRVVSILTNKGDPGAPSLNRANDISNFKSAKVTEERRSKYVAIIIILLVIAFVVPMVQFFYYVKDE